MEQNSRSPNAIPNLFHLPPPQLSDNWNRSSNSWILPCEIKIFVVNLGLERSNEELVWNFFYMKKMLIEMFLYTEREFFQSVRTSHCSIIKGQLTAIFMLKFPISVFFVLRPLRVLLQRFNFVVCRFGCSILASWLNRDYCWPSWKTCFSILNNILKALISLSIRFISTLSSLEINFENMWATTRKCDVECITGKQK